MVKVKVETVRPRLMSLEDAAKYLGLAPKTLRNRMCPDAKNPLPIPWRKYGKKILFEVADLDRFADSLAVHSLT